MANVKNKAIKKTKKLVPSKPPKAVELSESDVDKVGGGLAGGNRHTESKPLWRKKVVD